MSRRRLTRFLNRRWGSTEFPIALFVLFFLALFPLIDLCMLAASCAVVFTLNQQEATRAACQQNYTKALMAMSDEAGTMNGTPFAKFTQLKPVGGYLNCGSSLYVDATNYINQKVTTYGPNTPLASVDTTAFIYEYRVDTNFDMQPFVNLANVPFIGQVPGLGKTATLHWTCHKLCEFPKGLVMGGNNSNLKGGAGSVNLNTNGLQTPGTLTDLSNSTWETPNIYDLIKAAGETVIQEDVLIVQANNPDWTQTPIKVQPGTKIWIDYWANGAWTYRTVGANPSSVPWFSANGDPVLTNATGFPTGAMVGRVGSGPSFLLGKQKWNYSPPGTGQLMMAMNDDSGPGFPPGSSSPSGYVGNGGSMTVRVILAR